jgi:hypothetical protein
VAMSSGARLHVAILSRLVGSAIDSLFVFCYFHIQLLEIC